MIVTPARRGQTSFWHLAWQPRVAGTASCCREAAWKNGVMPVTPEAAGSSPVHPANLRQALASLAASVGRPRRATVTEGCPPKRVGGPVTQLGRASSETRPRYPANVSKFIRKSRLWASVPVEPYPSDPLNFRVADRVADRFAWQTAWQECFGGGLGPRADKAGEAILITIDRTQHDRTITEREAESCAGHRNRWSKLGAL